MDELEALVQGTSEDLVQLNARHDEGEQLFMRLLEEVHAALDSM